MGRQVSFQISDVVSACEEARSIEINQMAYELKRARCPLTVLSLGEAFFDIPNFGWDAVDFTQGYHYSDSQGIPSLRDKIAGYYGARYAAPVDGKSEVLITAGSKAAIYLAMLTALNPGDDIAIHEPCWLSYPHQARLCGAHPVLIPYGVSPQDFGAHLTPKTKMLVLNNPNNPAGRIYTRDELLAVYKLCHARSIYVLVDEAYSDFVVDGRFPSMIEAVPDKEGIIVVNSLSKNLGISGWRVGYAIAAAPFIRQLLKVNQHIITCAATPLLQYCDAHFDRLLEVTLPQVHATVEKRGRVATMIDGLGLERLPGGATFYFFVGIGNFPGTSSDFAMHLLLEHHVSVVPGSAYGDSTDRFVRISIGVESEDRILKALELVHALSLVNGFVPYDYKAALAAILENGRA